MIARQVKNPDERIIYSAKVLKINKRSKEQPRVLLITDKALYNLLPSDYSKCKRRIPIQDIGSITLSKASDEFVLHVPDEYDYRFNSDLKSEITKVIADSFRVLTNKSLKTQLVLDEVLGDVTLTKDKKKHMTREELYLWKKQQAREDHMSDHEEEAEAKSQHDEVEQLIDSNEKLTVDHFDLLKVLGRGSFGKVMQVRKKDNGKIYAMKILKKNMIVARQQVEHTISERKILAAMQHPFLMGLRYAFQTKTKLYLVMDFYRGGELFFHLKNERRFTEAQARIFVAEVALALGHLHGFNFIYRDLKPENVLMDENGHICLTDFGLSKDVDPNSPEAQTFCGTPEYLAPEILQGGGHGKAVDWWSLGILLYELTVGIPPFYSQNVNEMYHKIQHGVLRFPPFLSEECKDLIVQLLNRNPDARLGSSEADVEELKSHAFFASIPWEKLMKKEFETLYKPKVKGNETDTSLFDAQFTSEAVQDSVVPDSHLNEEAADKFQGFTFVPTSQLGGN